MAVAYVNTNSVTRIANGNVSASQTVTATGSNLLAVGMLAFNTVSGLSVTSGPTIAAAAMTSCGSLDHNTVEDVYVQCFYRVAPTTGSQTYAATVSGGTVSDTYFHVVVFNGVDPTTPISGYQAPANPTTNGSGNYAISITTANGNYTMTAVNGGGSGTTNTTQTSNGSNTTGGKSAASDRAASSTSSTTHTWSGGGASQTLAFCGFAIAQVSAGGGSGLRRNSSLSGLGATGPFFHDPLASAHHRFPTPKFARDVERYYAEESARQIAVMQKIERNAGLCSRPRPVIVTLGGQLMTPIDPREQRHMHRIIETIRDAGRVSVRKAA